MAEKVWRVIIAIVVGGYVLAPDLFPGPIDDAIVLGLGIFANYKLKAKQLAEKEEP